MLVDKSRDRLINAILYFAANTKRCGKTKLYKLLYLLDFEHFRQTGRSVTGSEYWAWERGPVPATLEGEWKNFPSDLRSAIALEPEPAGEYSRTTVRPLRPFDDSNFTPRQLALLKSLAEQYQKHTAEKMIDVAHESGGPWEQAWESGVRSAVIDYRAALRPDTPHREQIADAASEFDSLKSK